ncbi:DNA-binding PadR family transcriptional regulator [Hydrogenispora ethanolica]|uniref:DNA-binding PadR family transcriptional regulator n=1 Tax=Hydrogenispora ethanolica TaxID=1082276 RepID=A0A4R1R9C9_HYDET|nr:PadR family transcriptional regulator [Hydrogenispora ethanolica]TCL62314.1 DNA-binding PadR family transcriptional regulator [Hydrogenispora ethanolica]
MARLVILSMLQRRPMHGYEMQQLIQEEKMEQWLNILSGSIYFALNQMEKEGLIRTDSEERTGNRIRKIYAITDEGRRVYRELLRAALLASPHSLKSDFSFALGDAQFLAAEERDRLLCQNMRHLEELQRLWQAGLAVKADHHPAVKALLENDLAMIRNDLRFLGKLREIYAGASADGASFQPVRATHFLIRTTGAYRENSFSYEETVAIGEHENSQWWAWFHSQPAAEFFQRAGAAAVGECFTIADPQSKTVTEIVAIVKA